MSDAVQQLLAELYRSEYGKIVAVLVRRFGFQNLQVAEDIAQDAWLAAAQRFREDALPDNPAAWLMQVAKNTAINRVKQDGTRRRLLAAQAPLEEDAATAEDDAPDAHFEVEIEDAMLRMVFACCHPALRAEDQLVLILRTLAGFGVREIAGALLSTEEAIQKRFTRARARIVQERIELDEPTGAELRPRLQMVQTSLYLLFNEGYATSVAEMPVRRDLCMEAIRLTELVVRRFPGHHEVRALLALMYLHTARLESRISAEGALVVFADQDRSLWNRRLIHVGMEHLTESARGEVLSRYHLEASIAAMHCMARSFEDTNWGAIREMYEALLALEPSPLIRLNLAIVARYIEGPQASIDALEPLRQEPVLARNPLLLASLATFHAELGDVERAAAHYLRAQQLATSEWQRELLSARAAKVRGVN